MLALLSKRQFDAEVVCPGGGRLESELRYLNVKSYPLEFGRYSFAQNPLWHLDFYFRVREIINLARPDVVIINLDGNSPVITLAARRAGVPLIRYSRFEFHAPRRALDRWSWLQAEAIVCPSLTVAEQVAKWLPDGFEHRAHHLYEAFTGRVASRNESDAFKNQLGLNDERLIGYVGRIDRAKRLETVIEALPVVRRTHDDIRFLIIGGDDGSPSASEYRKQLEHLAERLGVRDALIFAGYRSAEEMPAAISALEICVLPSQSESFGMALMEAWAQGLPTVASDVAGCGEITKASGGGLLAPVGNVSAFASAIENLLSDQQLSQDLGLRGRSWVEENCSVKVYAEKFQSILDAILEGSK